MLAQAILYRGAGFATVWPQFLAIAFVGAALFGFSACSSYPSWVPDWAQIGSESAESGS